MDDLSLRHSFAEKKSRKLISLKSTGIQNWYGVSLSSLLFKNCAVISSVITFFLQNVGIDVVTFEVPLAHLC